METTISTLIEAIEARAGQFGWSCTRVDRSNYWLDVGPHKLLLWLLPEELASAEKSVEDGKETAFDEWLISGDAGVANITIFCVAPLGSIDQKAWNDLAAKVERDDLVCRKLVWLPRWLLEDVDVFLDRTFLARPWDRAVEQGPSELSVLAESLTVPMEWMERLLNPELEGVDLINALLEISQLGAQA
jgi:hypothetical protein